MAAPLISIIMPFYNAASTLPECIESIHSQTCTDFEALAINDGSSDDSAEIAATWASQDARVRIVRPGRVGLVAALNLGIQEARAGLIARMDADDLMEPERLEAQYTFLKANPQIALVGTQVRLFPPELIRAGFQEYIRWQNQCLSPEDISNNIYVESPFAHPSVMLRSAVFAQLGGYADGPFPEDYEFWLRMHAAGIPMAKLPRILLAWRESENRATRVDPRYARSAFDQLRARFLIQDQRLTSARPIVIWGAGRQTRLRARHIIEKGIQPVAWIDIDPRKIGHVVWDIPVHPPEWLDQQPRPFVLVYVTSHGAREYIDGLLAQWDYRIGRDYLGVG